MMKKLLLVSAVMCALVGVAASPAAARTSVFVAGTGASAVSGQVVVGAIATGPLVDGPFGAVAPAVGFVRTTNSSFGDLSGTVTCIGMRRAGVRRSSAATSICHSYQVASPTRTSVSLSPRAQQCPGF